MLGRIAPMPQSPSPSERPAPQTQARPESGSDRRRWPRALADLPITLAGPDGEHEARVRDVSRAGVCFFVDRPVPLWTVLSVTFDVPIANGRKRVAGSGAVVRCQRIAKAVDHWEIAVFLHDMTEPDRRALEQFVATRLTA
jgi:hypothetical protein